MRIVSDGHSTVSARKAITVRKLDIVRGEQLIGHPNGVVFDTKTGLEWLAGPDKNMTWYEAKRWARVWLRPLADADH